MPETPPLGVTRSPQPVVTKSHGVVFVYFHMVLDTNFININAVGTIHIEQRHDTIWILSRQ